MDPFSCTETDGTLRERKTAFQSAQPTAGAPAQTRGGPGPHLRPLPAVEGARRGADSWLEEEGGGHGLPHDIPPTERGLRGYGE